MPRDRPAPPDVVLPLLLLLGAAGYFWLSRQLPERDIPGSVGLAFVPQLLAGLLALLAGVLLVQGLRGRGARPSGDEAPGWGQAAAVVGLLALYTVALTQVGFPLATPPYLAVGMWQSGARRAWFILLMSLGVTAAIWLAFTTLFAVPLPRGPLF